DRFGGAPAATAARCAALELARETALAKQLLEDTEALFRAVEHHLAVRDALEIRNGPSLTRRAEHVDRRQSSQGRTERDDRRRDENLEQADASLEPACVVYVPVHAPSSGHAGRSCVRGRPPRASGRGRLLGVALRQDDVEVFQLG